MVAVRVMQMTFDQVVDMVAVWHRFVTAAGAVHVAGIMPTAGVSRSATVDILVAHLDHVLFDTSVGILMMQMPIVQIVGMAVVLHGRMTTAFAVLMIVVGVFGGHVELLTNRSVALMGEVKFY